MPKPGNTLDQLAFRVSVRNQMRMDYAGPMLYMFDERAENGQIEVSEADKRNWIITSAEMRDIDAALAANESFTSELIITKETTIAQANDAVKRMKRGDVSKFNHLPHFMREYYGRKTMIELFGTDAELPPLDDEVKKKLNDAMLRPEFRFVISKLIERNAKSIAGKSMVDRAMEYDQYMNKRLMAKSMDPVSPAFANNVRDKYPALDAEKLLNENIERQVFMAKMMFMAQLGRVDIGSGEPKQYDPFQQNLAELFSHSARVIFTLPHGDANGQKLLFDEFNKKTVDSGVMSEGRPASHEIYRRHVNDFGEMTRPAEERRIKAFQMKSLKENKKVATISGNYGMDIPLGGMGRKFNKTDCVDANGAFGHMYVRARKGSPHRCGAILVGIENARPSSESCIGQLHNYKAFSHDMSPFFSGKVTYGSVLGGREVDLSHMTPAQLQKALREFEAGYRELHRKAQDHPEALKELKGINSSLCGKPMDAISLAAMMTSLGMTKKDAITIVEAGRSAKDIPYEESRYPIEMQKITDPAVVSEPRFDPETKARMDEVLGMQDYVDSMKRQWNAMRSHTLFSVWNSAEFKSMENSMNRYLQAFDNVLAGKNVDGTEYRAAPSQLSFIEYDKLLELENQMVQAGRDYHQEKVRQKEGGFEKHITGQAKDRDAMSNLLSNFTVEARKNLVAPAPKKNMTKSQKAAEEKRKNEEARKKLDERVQKMGRS